RSRRPCPSRRERRRRVLATLIRVPGDFDLAEEALHEDLGSVVEFAEAARWSNGRGVAPLRSVRPKGAIAAPFDTAFWVWSSVSKRSAATRWASPGPAGHFWPRWARGSPGAYQFPETSGASRVASVLRCTPHTLHPEGRASHAQDRGVRLRRLL